MGNFYKRRTHSRFGKYKITGDRKVDEENRKLLDKMRYKFARPSTPKAVRAKRQKEREERERQEAEAAREREERRSATEELRQSTGKAGENTEDFVFDV